MAAGKLIMNSCKHIIKVLAVAAVIAGCTERSSEAENRSYFYDTEVQQAFIQKLENNKIEHRIDSEGAVWYHESDTAKVDRIKKEILGEHFNNPYSVYYMREEERSLFINELEKQGIKYNVKTKRYPRGDEDWISWSAADDEKVKQIRKKIRGVMQENGA